MFIQNPTWKGNRGKDNGIEDKGNSKPEMKIKMGKQEKLGKHQETRTTPSVVEAMRFSPFP